MLPIWWKSYGKGCQRHLRLHVVACQQEQLSDVLSHRPPAFHADEAQVPAGRHRNVRRHLEGLQHAFDKRPPEHNGHDRP